MEYNYPNGSCVVGAGVDHPTYKMGTFILIRHNHTIGMSQTSKSPFLFCFINYPILNLGNSTSRVQLIFFCCWKLADGLRKVPILEEGPVESFISSTVFLNVIDYWAGWCLTEKRSTDSRLKTKDHYCRTCVQKSIMNDRLFCNSSCWNLQVIGFWKVIS